LPSLPLNLNVKSGLTSVEGKIAQICPACLDQRARPQDPGDATAEAVPIFLMAPFAAFAGALLWAGFWIGHTLLFQSLHENTIMVPAVLVAVFVLLAGGLVGGPVGWIIKQNRRRGRSISKVAAILFSLLAVMAGELFYIVWLIYHQYQVVSFTAAVKVMPQYYLHNDFMYLAEKLIAAVLSIAIAEAVARPKAARLKL